MHEWLGQHGFDLVQTLGIVGGLLFTAYTIRRSNRITRVSNLLNITQHHRDIWRQVIENPKLEDILDPNIDLDEKEISRAQRLFVVQSILHLNAVFEAERADAVVSIPEMEQDVGNFYSLPIPRHVWNELRSYQSDRFKEFMDDIVSISEKAS